MPIIIASMLSGGASTILLMGPCNPEAANLAAGALFQITKG
jgi:hypothetical protein